MCEITEFNKNQEEFSNYIQKNIWVYGTRLLPLETTLPYVPEELKESCIDLYNFTYHLLSDMHNNITEYDLEPDYEADMVIDKKRLTFIFGFLKDLKILLVINLLSRQLNIKSSLKNLTTKASMLCQDMA